jgi:hypothetical protein
MNTSPPGPRESLEGASDNLLEAPSPTSRRQLLGTAVRSLVLVASGLFVPASLEETRARRGALGGSKGGRHGKNRRGRQKRRAHKRKKKSRNPPQAWPFRNVAVYVHNYWAPPAQLNTKGWQSSGDGKYVTPKGWDWEMIPPKAEDGSHSSREFIGGDMDVAVQLNSAVTVRAQNFKLETPLVEIYESTWSGSGKSRTGRLVAQQRLSVWDAVSVSYQNQGKVWTKVTRVPDSDGHIRFSVDLTETK